MKGNPALPGGPLTSKPAWSNTSGCSTTPAFFSLAVAWDSRNYQGRCHGQARSDRAAPDRPRGRCAFKQQRNSQVPSLVAEVVF